MGRRRQWVMAEELETEDRLAIGEWIGNRRLADVAPFLNRTKSWLSCWLRHGAEVRDTELALWEEVSGVSEQVLLNGRKASRLLRASGSLVKGKEGNHNGADAEKCEGGGF